MTLILIAVCIAMCTATEIGAYLFELWTYRSRWTRIANIVASGAVFGGLTMVLLVQPIAVRFVAGATLGVVHEAVNLWVLDAWSFPGGKLLFVRGRGAIMLAAGVPWGALPVLAPYAAQLVI